MEKQRVRRKKRISIGLLIFSLCLGNAVFAQSYSEMRSLHVTPQNGVIYSGKECMFELIIPAVQPSDVQIETPQLPADVNFVSMRRTDYIENDIQSGTEIDLWLSFDNAAEYMLPPLRIKIRNRAYSIPFDTVKVIQDPSTQAPLLIISFDNGTEVDSIQSSAAPLFTVHAGEKIRFTVFVQYAVQIMNFEWTVPKNALFTEIRKYDVTEGKPRSRESFAARISVGRFEWQPLSSGSVSLPVIRVLLTSYSGKRITLSQPDMRVAVLHADSIQSVPALGDESYFAYAFSESEENDKNDICTTVNEDGCEQLAQLRMKERHSLFQQKIALERRSLEKKFGITEVYNEPSVPLFFLLLTAAAAVTLAALVLFILKKRRSAIICITAGGMLFISTIVCGIRLSAVYGIFKGGSIHSVPDEVSGFVSPVDSGQCVRIEERAGRWIYIQYGSIGGWISSSSVIVIR
jgi:hypothetical protein